MSQAICSGPPTPDEPLSDLADPAFEGLYLEYAPRVASHLARRLNVRPGEVEDLTQEVFLRAYRARDLIDHSRPIWPFLRTIATRLAIDEHRRADQRRSQLMSDVPESGDAPGDPWEGYVAGERREALAAALSALPPRSHRLVLLKDAAGFEYDELARIDGVSVQALRSVISRARRTLRDSYVAQMSNRGLAAIVAPAVLARRFIDRKLRFRRGIDVSTASRLAEFAPAGTNTMLALAAIGVSTLAPTAAALGALPAAAGAQSANAAVMSSAAPASASASGAAGTVPETTDIAVPDVDGVLATAPPPGGISFGAETPPGPAGANGNIGLKHNMMGGMDVASFTSQLGVHAGPWVVSLMAHTEFDCRLLGVVCQVSDSLPTSDTK